MNDVDQAPFAFDPAVGVAVTSMVGFLVFAAALDLEWGQLRRVLRSPRAPVVGLVAQFGILPGVAFLVATFVVDVGSVGLGLLLVASCPGGALSNYLTSVARGDVATSVCMTTASTVACAVTTPVVFGFWASMDPRTAALLDDIRIEPGRVVAVLLVMVVVPVTAGMLVAAKRPAFAAQFRRSIRLGAMVVFTSVVLVIFQQNGRLLVAYAEEALFPVVLTFGSATVLGFGFARLAGLDSAERRAATLEVSMQNVGLAIGTAVAFFPTLVGAAITAALWGFVHLTCGFALAAVWARVPPTPLRAS